MDYQKALKILGLKPNFTAEELKKAHRELANLYHPDRNKSPEAESKMKNINEARDYLVKYARIYPNSTNEKKSQEAEMYYREKLDELSNITKFDFNKHKLSNKLKEVIDAIQKIVYYYRVYTDKKEKETVHQEYEEYLKMIKYRFKELTSKFYEENKINDKDVKETINYNCTLEELYQQLLKIKEKYGKETIIKNLLEKETEKYKSYIGYDKINNRIEKCINEKFCKIKDNDFNYTQKDINDMHIEIEQIFKTYYILFKKISELENIVNTIENQEIINYYKLIERNFYSGIPYSEFDEHINELEDLIDKYNKEKQKKIEFKKNEAIINQIYQSLINRCSDEIKKYDIVVTEPSQIDIKLNLLKELVELFIKGYQEFKDLEYFNLFNQITFIDTINDSKIKETIIKKYNFNNVTKINNSKIYIKKKDKCKRIFDYHVFCCLDKDRMKMYFIINSRRIAYENITQQELDENYISLDELLNNSEYVGKWMVDLVLDEKIYIYYQTDGYIIYRSSDKQEISIQVNPRKHYDCDQKDMCFISEKFKDKKVMQELIEKQIKQQMDENNQEKSRNDRRYSFDPNSKEYKNIYGERAPYNYDNFDFWQDNNNLKKRK